MNGADPRNPDLRCTDSYIANNRTTQLRTGPLELCVLTVIGRRPVYGYDTVKQLRAVDALVSARAPCTPILSRLKRDGLVHTSVEESSEGPARKSYEAHRAGRNARRRDERVLGRADARDSCAAKGAPPMISFTPEARLSLDRYPRPMKIALRASGGVDHAQVERDLIGHIEAELAGAGPVTLQALQAARSVGQPRPVDAA